MLFTLSVDKINRIIKVAKVLLDLARHLANQHDKLSYVYNCLVSKIYSVLDVNQLKKQPVIKAGNFF